MQDINLTDSETFIALLLQEDLRIIGETLEAEMLQLEQVLSDSALASARTPEQVERSLTVSDVEVALAIAAAEAQTVLDAACAQDLKHSHDASLLLSQQFAQKLHATEKKFTLDAEFAKKLDEINRNGDANTDDPRFQDADNVLGHEFIEQLLAEDLNTKGKNKMQITEVAKGKGRCTSPDALESSSQTRLESEDEVSALLSVVLKLTPPECGICLEALQLTHSPRAASLSANSSRRLPFGVSLPCPGSHSYCLNCISAYILTKLDPEGSGAGNLDTFVFPISCPECLPTEWTDGITDEVAERVLDAKSMLLWHQQRRIDSLPRQYCPNPHCSALLQLHNDPDQPRAACHVCDTSICVPCGLVQWHNDFTCEEYQALPLDERLQEDLQALNLMKVEHWRRCPKCAIIVELTSGCHHITCRCGTQFCFRCGSLWDIKKPGCMRVPSCELWDEHMLLEANERQRPAPNEVLAPIPADPAPIPAAPAWRPQGYAPARPTRRVLYTRSLDWMMEPGILITRHAFTGGMIRSLTCQYCSARMNSLAALRYHLEQTRKHAVYACCGRFFKEAGHFSQHSEASSSYHSYTVEN